MHGPERVSPPSILCPAWLPGLTLVLALSGKASVSLPALTLYESTLCHEVTEQGDSSWRIFGVNPEKAEVDRSFLGSRPISTFTSRHPLWKVPLASCEMSQLCLMYGLYEHWCAWLTREGDLRHVSKHVHPHTSTRKHILTRFFHLLTMTVSVCWEGPEPRSNFPTVTRTPVLGSNWKRLALSGSWLPCMV